MKTKKLISILITAALLLSFTGCSEGGKDINSPVVPSAGGSGALSTSPSGIRDEVGGGADGVEGSDAAYDAELVGEGGLSMDYAAGDADFMYGGESSGGATNSVTPQAGLLTAGEWIDNDHWSFWQNLYQLNDQWEYSRKTWNKSFVKRYFVTVAANGTPLENVSVKLADKDNNTIWEARTDNEGKCYLFIDSSANNAAKITADATHELDVTAGKDAYSFDLTAGENAAKALDLMLVFDTTGSMGDELTYLQSELEDVVNKAVSNNANLPARVSVNFYRDDGDEYVIRPFDFTDNLTEVITNLRAQSSDGGGDMPEYVNGALNNAINEHEWAENSTKLLFIILDAPPHSESPEAVQQMNTLAAQAAAKGIRIIPVVSSGANKETEYLMRDLAIKTGGTYVFLTNDSGIGGGHMIPTTGEYKVEKLNELLVRVIDRYLAVNATAAQYKDEAVEIVIPEETTTEPGIEYPGDIMAMDVSDGDVVTHYDYTSGEVKRLVEWMGTHDTEMLDNKPELSDNIAIYKYTFYMSDGSVGEMSMTSDWMYIEYEGNWFQTVKIEDAIYD